MSENKANLSINSNESKFEKYINGYIPYEGRIINHRFNGNGFEYYIAFQDETMNKWSALDTQSNSYHIREYWDFCKYIEEKEVPKSSKHIKIYGTGKSSTKGDIDIDPYYYGVAESDFMYILSKNILQNHYNNELLEYFENGLDF